MDALDRLCLRIARQRRIERVLGRVLPWAGISGLAGATALAVIRLAVPDAGWLATGVTAAAALAPLVVLPMALRTRDPAWLIAGHADRLSGSAGLAMALATQPGRDPHWMATIEARLRGARLPSLRLPHVGSAVFAAALLAGAWFLPQTTAPPAAPPIASGPLANVTRTLATIADQRLAAPEAIAAFAERLAAVRQALGEHGLDQQTWAALDALDRDLSASQALAADKLADALAKAEHLAGLDAGGELAQHAAADLAAALADLERQAPGLAAKLPAGAEGEALLRLAQQAMAGGELTEAQRQALQRWGLDPAKVPPGGGGPGDAEAARRLADRLAGELAARAGMAGGEGQGLPGQGGPGPGGGHPELTWGDIERISGGFRDRLEGGTPNNPQTGAAVGSQLRAPRQDEQRDDPGERAATVEQAATSADARRATVAPRHRAAVAAYFDAPQPPGSPRP